MAIPSLLNNIRWQTAVLAGLSVLLMVFREKLSFCLLDVSDRYTTEWGWIYTIDMACWALMLHAVYAKNLWFNFITETFAWFAWSDVADRTIFRTTGFTLEDAIFISVAILTLAYKTYKWNKANGTNP